jgi:flagellar basal-body rod protein FlgG
MRNSQIAASVGAFRQQRRIFHLTANNLSNVQTVGFKKDVPIFHNVLNQVLDSLQPIPEDGMKTVFDQGTIQKTGNALDLAIDGDGFFKVKTPSGIRYTRAGNFVLSKNKVLTNAEGFPIMGGKKEITLEGNQIVIEKDGAIKVDGNEIDKIALVTFSDLNLLEKEGHTLFRLMTPTAEKGVEQSQTLQGYLEQSNVNTIEEMVKLIDSFRTYEACLKTIQSNDEMDGKAVNEVGRV